MWVKGLLSLLSPNLKANSATLQSERLRRILQDLADSEPSGLSTPFWGAIGGEAIQGNGTDDWLAHAPEAHARARRKRETMRYLAVLGAAMCATSESTAAWPAPPMISARVAGRGAWGWRALEEAPLILSKGQGNFEGLSDEALPIFFLLKAKCLAVAREIGVPQGSILLLRSPHFS